MADPKKPVRRPRVENVQPKGQDTASPEQAGDHVDSPREERAEFVAQSIVPSVAPGRAREEAQAAQVRARAAGDPDQAAVEARLAELLLEVADKHDEEQREIARNRTPAGRSVVGKPLRVAQDGQPIPAKVKRGVPVLVHTDHTNPDVFGIVVRVHPKVKVGDKEVRLLADVALFPVNGGNVAVQNDVPFGEGVGQFSELPDDEDEQGLPEGVSVRDTQTFKSAHDGS